MDNGIASIRGRLGRLRRVPFNVLMRVAVRKYIYSRVVMGWYACRCGDVCTPAPAPSFRMEVVGGPSVDFATIANPFLNDQDFAELSVNPAADCVIAWEGDELAGSTWMLHGRVAVHELDRNLTLPVGHHYSCRTHVHEAYHGRGLMGQMIAHYAALQSADDTLCGVIFDWNQASVKSVLRLGWSRTGTLTTTRLLGRQRHAGEYCGAP